MTTIKGKVEEWSPFFQEFLIGTPVGDIKIQIEKDCAGILEDMLVDAMKNRLTIEIIVEKPTKQKVKA